jgi:hypothetical protein
MKKDCRIMDESKDDHKYVLVEGPSWGDARFYGGWLLKAARAEALWRQVRNSPTFKDAAERLTVAFFPDFGIAATIMLAYLRRNFVSFTIPLYGEEGNEFAMMTEMGFFVRTGERYKMAIPKRLKMNDIKSAALKFVQTADSKCVLHPEYLVAAVPKKRAERMQRRLRKTDDSRRCADRAILLGNASS